MIFEIDFLKIISKKKKIKVSLIIWLVNFFIFGYICIQNSIQPTKKIMSHFFSMINKIFVNCFTCRKMIQFDG